MSTNISKFSTTNETQFAICVQNADYSAPLELHKIYQVVPDADAVEDEDIRIIDESGEDYLYPLGVCRKSCSGFKNTLTSVDSEARSEGVQDYGTGSLYFFDSLLDYFILIELALEKKRLLNKSLAQNLKRAA